MLYLVKIKVFFGQEKVYKEECVFLFDNLVSINRMEKIEYLNIFEEFF